MRHHARTVAGLGLTHVGGPRRTRATAVASWSRVRMDETRPDIEWHAPWRGSHARRSMALVGAALLGIGAFLGRHPGWWPEAIVLVVIVLLLASAPSASERHVDWRPWRGPHPVRNTVANVLKLIAVGVALAGYWVDVHERYWSWPFAVSFTLMCASAYASTVTPFRRSNRVFWTFFVLFQWWLLYRTGRSSVRGT